MSLVPRNPKPGQIIFLVAFLLTIPWIGLKDFYSRGEPREAIVAQSMVAGQWLTGSGYGGAVPSKPPFTHWMMALVSLPVGEVTEFTARLPAAIAWVGFVWGFFIFLRRRTGEVHALLSAFILMGSAEWFRAGVSCRVDTVLAALISGALLLLFKWYEDDFKTPPYLISLLLAAATLTKGPVALVLCAAPFGLFLLYRRENLFTILLALMRAVLPALLLALVWYMAAFAFGGDAYQQKFYYENIARFASTMEDDPHAHSALYLYGTVLVGFLPWTLLLIPELVRRAGNFKEWRKSLQPPSDSLRVYSLVVILVILTFYSLPSSKRSVYLLPAYPFMAIFVADWVSRFRAQGSKWFSTSVIAGVFGIGLLLNAAVFPYFANQRSPKAYARSIEPILGLQKSIYSFGYEFYGISFYSGRSINRLMQRPQAGDLILCFKERVAELEALVPGGMKATVLSTSEYDIEKRNGRVVLLRIDEV